MSHYANEYSYRYFLLLTFFIMSCTLANGNSGLPTTNNSSLEEAKGVLSSISTRFRVFEAENCQLSGIKLKARAESCQASDKLVWKYIVTNLKNDKVLQYSYNYTPVPQTGEIGDHTLDKINQTFEAHIVILSSLELGEYRADWTLTINDEYSVEKAQYFEVVDNVAPTPDLYYSIEKNSSYLEARDFDKGDCDNCIASKDNCSDRVFFTFSDKLPDFDSDPNKWEKQFFEYGKYFFDPKSGQISTEQSFLDSKADAWIPERSTAAKAITCDMLHYYKNKDLNIYVWDEFLENDDKNYNNFSIQKVYLQANIECQDFKLEGVVKGIKSSLPLKNMNISFIDDNESFNTKTDSNGYYLFDHIKNKDDIKIIATKDSDWLNGVTTLDIVIIQRHLLGINRIDDPYALLAADVNRDKKISASDILELRKLILGRTNKFDKNNSWVGIPTHISIPAESSSLIDFDKIINKHFSIDSESTTIDFDAIKIGDVNQSAEIMKSRNDKTISFILKNKSLNKGEIVKIPFYAKDFNNIYGGQFSISLEEMNFSLFEEGAIHIDTNNYYIEGDNLYFSWNSPRPISIEDDAILFNLIFKVNDDIKLKEALTISDNSIQPEVYIGTNFENYKLKIDFQDNEYDFSLYQNQPNPFRDYTIINFTLPSDNEYAMTIYNMSGQLIKQFNGVGREGLNTLHLRYSTLEHDNTNTRLNAPYILIYKLVSANDVAIKKMVILPHN